MPKLLDFEEVIIIIKVKIFSSEKLTPKQTKQIKLTTMNHAQKNQELVKKKDHSEQSRLGNE